MSRRWAGVRLGKRGQRQLFLPILRADFALHDVYRYVPGKPINRPISAFGGLEGVRANRNSIAAWREQTHGPLTLCMFPGNHFFLRSARTPLLQAVSQDLKTLLR